MFAFSYRCRGSREGNLDSIDMDLNGGKNRDYWSKMPEQYNGSNQQVRLTLQLVKVSLLKS